MDGFWHFVGNYWWLGLVFGGSIASAIGGFRHYLDKRSRVRHKRRLEILKAKSELEAVKRSGGVVPVSGPAAVSSTQERAQRLSHITALHDDVRRRWLDYELDVGKLIAFPAMSDGRQSLTAAFLRAGKKADGLRPESGAKKVSEEDLTAYAEAVTDYETAFDIAERDARRQKDQNFTEPERKRLDRAQKLLTVAIDQAATPAERHVAYKRVREELDGLIAVSDQAYTVLEEKVALSLESGNRAANRVNAEPTADPRAAD